MGKKDPVFSSIWMVLMGVILHSGEAALKTTFIEDLCYNKNYVVLDLRYEPTGILMSLPLPQELTGLFDCQVILAPPRESSVVLSIYRYDIGSEDLLTIEDSDRHMIALIGYGNFKDERKSVISSGRMTIRYRRNETAAYYSRQGFQFTFTAVKNGPCFGNEFQCNNRKCILKEYVCDGHNHCGDGSDQKTCVPKNDGESNTGLDKAPRAGYLNANIIWISIIGACGAAVFIIVIVFIVVMTRRARKLKATAAATDSDSNNQNGGGNPPLQSVSSTIPQQQPPAHAAEAVPSAPPAPEHERFSFYNRVRRSLRGVKNPKTEDAPKEIVNSEVYQVPSMYPNLDQQVSSAEGGIENPEFKSDE